MIHFLPYINNLHIELQKKTQTSITLITLKTSQTVRAKHLKFRLGIFWRTPITEQAYHNTNTQIRLDNILNVVITYYLTWCHATTKSFDTFAILLFTQTWRRRKTIQKSSFIFSLLFTSLLLSILVFVWYHLCLL